VQIGKTLDEKLPRLGMASVKLLDEAHFDRVRARPAPRIRDHGFDA